VESHDEAAQLGLSEVLKLIDQQANLSLAVEGGLGYGNEKVAKIIFKVAAVGSANLGINSKFDFGVIAYPDPCLEPSHETAEDPKAPLGLFAEIFTSIELKKYFAERGNEQSGEGFVFVCLHQHGMKTALLGEVSDPVEENGLADATKADEDLAAGWISNPETLHGSDGVIDDFVASSQFGRLGASTGGVWILNWIH
jgi:hypothetical protein